MRERTPLAVDALHHVTGRHSYSQDALADQMRETLRHIPNSKAARQMVGFVYGNSAIDQRHFEIDIDGLADRRDWYRTVNEATESMAVRTLETLFQRADDARETCDGLVVVSSSYAGFPALSRRLQHRFRMQPGALCYDLSGLGCAGPTQGLYLAHTLLESGRCTRVCIVAVDALGTHGQSRRHIEPPSTAQLVAHCLASDAAAAVVLSHAEPTRPALWHYRTCQVHNYLWSEALAENDFTACADNQPYIAVGKNIRTRLIPELERFFSADGADVPTLLHPGGAALMRQVAERYPNLNEAVELSNAVLRDNGNVGAASVLLVLSKALAAGFRPGPDLRLFALGPGIVTSAVRFCDVEFGQ